MPPRANHPETHNALNKGQRLDEFEILGIVGVGGFGIVYRAYDHALQREVAVKEYLPASLAGRNANQQVSVLSQSHAETFALGLRSFIGEARMLARFDHPGLLKVHRFWEGNGTAYMVMPMLHGHTLRALRQAMAEAPDEAWLRHLLDGLLGPLEVLHQADVFHRDIAPDNIHIATDGAAILLDFGAARQVIAGRSQNLTAMLKPSYAPIEQYGEAPDLRQGAWTDLYALGATLHYLIAGAPPPPAPVRAMAQAGAGLSATARAGISAGFLHIVDWMLAPHPAHRPQSVAQLRAALAGQCQVPQAVAAVPATVPWPRTELQPPPAAAPGGGDDDTTVLQPRTASASAATPTPAPTPAPALAAPASPAAAAPAPARRLWPLAAAVLLAGAAVLAWVAQRTPAPAAPPPAARALGAPAAVAPAPGSAATLATSTPALAPAVPPAPAPAPAPAPEPALAASVSSLPGASTPDAGRHTPTASATRPPAGRPATARPVSGTAASTALPAFPGAQPALANTPAAAPAPATAAPQAASPSTPVPAVPAAGPGSPSSPNEACGKRVFIALHQCLLRECARPEFQAHPSCVALGRMEEKNRPRDLQ